MQDVLKSLESHQQVFQRIHKDRSVDGVSVPPDQLQDMAERYQRQEVKLTTSFGMISHSAEYWAVGLISFLYTLSFSG